MSTHASDRTCPRADSHDRIGVDRSIAALVTVEKKTFTTVLNRKATPGVPFGVTGTAGLVAYRVGRTVRVPLPLFAPVSPASVAAVCSTGALRRSNERCKLERSDSLTGTSGSAVPAPS